MAQETILEKVPHGVTYNLSKFWNGIVNRLKFTFSKQGIKSMLTSPTFVWFSSLYFSTLLMMIAMNIARVGFIKGILTGPQYFARIFLTYGLNATSTYNSPWFGASAWIFAPFLAIWLGVPLYMLKDAGYAYNGPRQDPQGVLFYAFFREDVYGFDVRIFGDKGNLFYIGIVWLPIIIASINTIWVKRRTKRNTSMVTRFFVSFIIAVIVAIQFSKMTDPNLHFSFQGLMTSLFDDRKYNHFELYDGAYPPMYLATLMALFQMVPMIILGIIEASLAYYELRKLKKQMHVGEKKEKVIKQKRPIKTMLGIFFAKLILLVFKSKKLQMYLHDHEEVILLPWELDEHTENLSN